MSLLYTLMGVSMLVGVAHTASQPSTAMTPLQKHVSFFDRNKDGRIYPCETFKGLRAIGINLPLSVALSPFIQVALSIKTKPADKMFPSMNFPILVENIEKAEHGSNTGSYDDQGYFVEAKFDEMFQKNALTTPNALTRDELNKMVKANRQSGDYGGWLSAQLELPLLYTLAKDKDGLLQKETLRGVYDGSLFYKLEADRLLKAEGGSSTERLD